MKHVTLHDENGVRWIVFGRDPEKSDHIVDTNEFLIIANGEAILLDPGGVEIAVAVGRAQIAAAHRTQDFLRRAHFVAHHRGVDTAQRRVVIGVVADAMAGGVHGCGKAGMRRHLPADHEEVGVRAILGQD